LPAHKVLYRLITLPVVDEKKLAELMNYEVRQQIPFPSEHVAWGYQSLGAWPTGSEQVNERQVALLALKLDEARAAVSQLSDRGLKVEILTSDSVALYNFVMFEAFDLDGTKRDTTSAPHKPQGKSADAAALARAAPSAEAVTAILDMGTDSSNLIITNGQALLMRSIPLGGNSLSSALVREFQLTFAQAEKVKRCPTAVRELHRLYGALEPRFADLVREVRRTMDGFLQADPRRSLRRFVIAGGALKLHGALRYLSQGV
jgi:type IV pilus assembly protein PilM